MGILENEAAIPKPFTTLLLAKVDCHF